MKMFKLDPAPTLRRILTEDEIKEVIKEGKIAGMSLRIPTPCNLNCLYCYGTKEGYRRLSEQGVALNFKEITNTLDQAFELGAKTISIVGDGEPLMYRDSNKNIFDLIDYSNKNSANVVLFINGTLITREKAQDLYERDVVVVAKQNSSNPQIQNQLCGRTWALDKLTKGLENLIEVGFTRTEPSRLAIHTVICKQNYDEIPNLWREWRKQKIIPYVQVIVPPKTKEEQERFFRESYVEPGKVRNLFHKLLEIDQKEFRFTWDADKTYPIAALGCSVVRTQLGIAPNGDVLACAYTEDPLGNIREQSLREILNSDKVRKIRNTCYSEDGSLHYGCRALTLNLTGDRFAKDPFYWE